MRDSRKISAVQVFFLVVLLMNGSYSLLLPQSVGRHVDSADGAFVILISAVLGLVMLFLMQGIGKAYPKEGIVAGLSHIVGGFWGKLIGFLLFIHFMILAIFYLACFHEMLGAELLPNTPRWLIMTATIILIRWLVYNGLEDIARFGALLAPVVIFMLILVLVGNGQDMHFVHMLPFGNGEYQKWFQGIKMAFPLFLAVTCLLVVHVRVVDQKKVWRLCAVAIIGSGVYLASMFLAVIAIFGVQEGVRIVWPLVELARMVRIGPFLERLESVFIAVWLTIAFLNGSILAYCSTQCWRELDLFQGTRWVNNLLTGGLVWLGAIMVNDMVRLFMLQWFISNIQVWVIVLLLVVIRVILYWQSRKEKRHAET